MASPQEEAGTTLIKLIAKLEHNIIELQAKG